MAGRRMAEVSIRRLIMTAAAVLGLFGSLCMAEVEVEGSFSASAANQLNPDCGCTRQSDYQPSPISSGKLRHRDDIMKGFEQGQERVRVIVNLTEPTETRARTNWHSKNSLAILQEKIRAVQTPVLSEIDSAYFRLRHCFENQAGFSGEVTLAGLEKLKNDPRVVSIEPVYTLEPHLRQGIPLARANTHRSTYNGQGVAIAICDTGIDYTHPMLGGGGFPNSKVLGGYDFGDGDSNPIPNGNAHGTCCAGIAAGNLDDTGDYIGGVAYSARLYALKISEGTGGTATTDAMVAAWDWCVTHKNDNPSYPILVVSTSFGGGRYYSTCDGETSAMTQAANNAAAAGITVLASSGNDGYCDSMGWPACISSVISVGAVYDAAFGTYLPCVSSGSCATKYSTTGCSTGYYASDITAADKVTSYSNTASFLTILAPSNQCYTTDISGSSGYSTSNYYAYFGGTSAACPYAAGVVACLQSAAKSITGSYLSAAAVRDKLIATGNDITDGKVAITKPRINMEQVINSLYGQPTASNLNLSIQAGTAVSITLQAVDDGLPNPPGQITYIITSLPNHATLSDPGYGIINTVPYTLSGGGNQVVCAAEAGYNGQDSFKYKASDGGTPPSGGESNAATVTLQIFNAVYMAMMDTDPGWTLDSGWQWGTPTGGGGQYGNPDPTSGYTGSNVVGYNLAGDYENLLTPTRWAMTPAINCTGFNGVTLSFYRWLNVEQPLYDHAYIQVSNNGSTWTAIWQNTAAVTDSMWILLTYDISSVADNQASVYIRWGMGPTDASWRFSGWNIDDVIVTGSGQDAAAPSPNPMTWLAAPAAAGTSQITMTATTAADISNPVSYFFEFVDSPTGGAGGSSSGWQISTTYTNTELETNHRYGYKVKAKDALGNETAESSPVMYCYTNAAEPQALDFNDTTSSSVRANWTTGGNPPGTLYRCVNTTTSQESGWFEGTSWVCSDLSPYQEYYFTVYARNGDGIQTAGVPLGMVVTVRHEPVISGITPPCGPAGSVIQITGQYFYEGGSVLIDGAEAEVLSWSSNAIVCMVPYSSTSGMCVVRSTGDSQPFPFTLIQAGVLYVSTGALPDMQNGSVVYPFASIKQAISAAAQRATIIVADGTYSGPGNHGITFEGKTIRLKSENGPAACVIDCQYQDKAFEMSDGEDANSVIEGFTITGGYDGWPESGIPGGAIACIGSSPTILNCVITGNYGAAAAIYCQDSNSIISNCVVTQNISDESFGGIYLVASNPYITGCTIALNSGQVSGGGVAGDYSNPVFINTIIYDNAPSDVNFLESAPEFIFCCIGSGWAGGANNIYLNPLFADAGAGDLRLRWNSPCVDSGSNEPNGGLPAFDIYGKNRSQDGNLDESSEVDIGAYEYSPVIVPDSYPTIQAAIDASMYGEPVIVSDGIYTGSGNVALDLRGKAITVRSRKGPAGCIIDCQGLERGFYFHSGEDSNSVVDGFTIINGYDGDAESWAYGSGIACLGSSPTIRNCVISDCGGIVGGVNLTDSIAVLEGCIIRDNATLDGIGGIFVSGGNNVLRNTIISGNSGFGGAIYASLCNLAVINCTIADNIADAGVAGGITCDYSDVSITNSILWNNSGDQILPWESSLAVSYSSIANGFSGTGNLSDNPLFADPNDGDYHLQSQYGRWDPNQRLWINDEVTSPCIDAGDPAAEWKKELWPHGGRINIGAYGGTAHASMSPNAAGSPIDLNSDGFIDFSDYAVIVRQWMYDNLSYADPMSGDVSRDGAVNFLDLAAFFEHWLDVI